MTKLEKKERLQILKDAIDDGTWRLEDLYNERTMFHLFLQDYIVEEYNKQQIKHFWNNFPNFDKTYSILKNK